MKPRYLLSFMIGSFCVQLCAAQSDLPTQRAKFSAAEVQEDLIYLYNTLEQTHYNLYANTKKEVFDRQFNKIYQSITDSLTPLQITRTLQPFVALSKLAHCNISFPWSLYFDSLNQKSAALFPLAVTIIHNRAFITDNYSDDPSIKAGDEILSIDGIPFDVRLNEIHNFLSGEDHTIKNSLMDLLTFSRVYWWVYGNSKQYILTVKQRNGSHKNAILKALQAENFEQQASKQRPVFSVNREFKFIGNIGYLHPGIFMNNKSSGNTSEHKTFETGEFISFVDSSFIELRKSRVQDLIIDLRGNPGGDNSFSDPMIAYFATKPFWFCSAFNVKTSSITKQFWKDVNDPSLQDLKNQILTRKDGETFTVSFENYSPKADSLRFKGKVYVLIDRFSYSNAVSAAAIVQDYHFGIVIGEPTADVASSYAAIHEFQLPNSRLNVSYPKAFIVRPNGDKALRGVTPDVEADDDAFTKRDEVLDFAIEYINRK